MLAYHLTKVSKVENILEIKFVSNNELKNISLFYINLDLDKCCKKIEVYYSIKNDAYARQFRSYGTYTKMPEGFNNRSLYQLDILNRVYGIWWGGDNCKYWFINDISRKGKCAGYVRGKPNTTSECIENTGWNWNYYDYYDNTYKEAKKGLGVRCFN